MNRKEIEKKVELLFRNVFLDENLIINDSMVADDVEAWDSLNHTIMIADVENEFNVKFGIREILKMQNVGDMITLLEEKIKK